MSANYSTLTGFCRCCITFAFNYFIDLFRRVCCYIRRSIWYSVMCLSDTAVLKFNTLVRFRDRLGRSPLQVCLFQNKCYNVTTVDTAAQYVLQLN